jgi:hypothetical protein
MVVEQYNTWNYRKCATLYRKMQLHCSSNLVAATCIDITNDIVDRIGKNKDFPTQPFSASAIALVEPIDHTMAYALPPYVLSKVPTAYIYEAAQLDMKVLGEINLKNIFLRPLNNVVLSFAFGAFWMATSFRTHGSVDI